MAEQKDVEAGEAAGAEAPEDGEGGDTDAAAPVEAARLAAKEDDEETFRAAGEWLGDLDDDQQVAMLFGCMGEALMSSYDEQHQDLTPLVLKLLKKMESPERRNPRVDARIEKLRHRIGS